MSEQYVAAIDQGTTSTRCMIFNRDGRVVTVDQKEHEQIFPRAGWVEHNATEIWNNTREVIAGALAKADLNADATSPPSASPTSARPRWCGTAPPASRSTTPSSGRTPAPTPSVERARRPGRRRRAVQGQGRAAAGHLLLGPEGARGSSTTSTAPGRRREAGNLVFGNMDTWVLWNMTGGVDGGLHVTDPTNASRTMLMDLDTLSLGRGHRGRDGHPAVDAAGDPVLAREVYGEVRERGIAARRADRRRSSATSRPPRSARRACRSGEAKNTYGTGNFMLINTGTQKVPSKNGLLTTVCYKIGDNATVLRAGGLDRGDRVAGAVDPRQPRA